MRRYEIILHGCIRMLSVQEHGMAKTVAGEGRAVGADAGAGAGQVAPSRKAVAGWPRAAETGDSRIHAHAGSARKAVFGEGVCVGPAVVQGRRRRHALAAAAAGRECG